MIRYFSYEHLLFVAISRYFRVQNICTSPCVFLKITLQNWLVCSLSRIISYLVSMCGFLWRNINEWQQNQWLINTEKALCIKRTIGGFKDINFHSRFIKSHILSLWSLSLKSFNWFNKTNEKFQVEIFP